MKRNIMSIVSVIVFALIFSCDDNENFGGDTRDFDTVIVYAAYGADAYTADPAVWKDESDPPDDICDVYYCYDDDIFVTVTSEVKASLECDCDASSIKLVRYIVEYIPHEDSPAVPDKQIYHHMEIAPGTTADIPIRIVDQEDKCAPPHPLNYNDYLAWEVATGGVSYEYTVRVSMKMEEISSGDQEWIEVEFPLYYFDVAEECT